MRILGRALVLAALTASASAFALEAHQQVEDGPVGVGQPFQLTVSVEGAQRTVGVELPHGDFQVLGKSRSSNVEMTSGPRGMETHRTEQFTFTLRAARAGRLVIPAARVVADGEELASEPAEIEVQREPVARAQPPDDDADPFAAMMKQFGGGAPDLRRLLGAQDPFGAFAGEPSGGAPLRPGDVRLEAVADRKTAFPGQQITVSFYLHTRASLASVNGLELPAVAGAATRDLALGKRLVPEQQGAEARVLVARKAIFADAPGPLRIESAKAKVAGVDGQELTVESEPLRLSVAPLPPGPAGAVVGSWTLSLAGPSRIGAGGPSPIRAGEPATFRVTAQGFGDLESLPAPVLKVPADWKVFPPATSETPQTSGERVGGTRSWDFVAIPASQGEVVLPAVELREFDPQAARYVDVKSEPLHLSIGAAESAASGSATEPPGPAPAPQSHWSRAATLGAASLLALAFIVALFLIWRGRARATAPRDASLDDARRDLEAARALCESQQASSFFAALTQALNNLAASLGDRDAPREDPNTIAARLKGRGIPAPVCESISRAFEACRRFAFLNSTDEAVLRRSLALTEEAFADAA